MSAPAICQPFVSPIILALMIAATHFSERAAAQLFAELERFESDFSKLENKLAHQKGVTNPRALAAWIGDKKYGKEEMAKRAASSRKRE